MQPIIFRHLILFFLFFGISEAVFAQKKIAYNPNKKFSPQELKEDFRFLRFVIEGFHAGANWYTSADSLANLFNIYEKNLIDSLTERQFRNQLMTVTEPVKCGHSGINSSKGRQKYFKKKPIHILPFSLYYIDSQVVVMNNFSKDSSIKIGSRVKSIEGIAAKEIIHTMFSANNSDGFNETNRYYSFERGLQFEYTRHYTEKDSFQLAIEDSLFQTKNYKVAAILSDSFPFAPPLSVKSLYENKGNRFFLSPKDSTLAVLDLQAERMMGYKKFYKKTFKYLKINKIRDLVIDLRGNGGGFMLNPGELLGYLIASPDYVEVYRNKQSVSMRKVLGNRSWVRFTEVCFPWLRSVRRVKSDKNMFHIRIHFKPKHKYFFDGKIYVLTDGGTFSAASYIAAYLKKHQRATFIGTETGGGEAGCNAFLLPYIELPNTKLQYRLPLYRVQHNTTSATFGHGIFPDFLVQYNLDNLLKKKDLEIEKVLELKNKSKAPTP